jgi:UDP-N-acetylglucosamine 2-epimerase
MLSVLAHYHYAPTALAKRNLLAEGVPSKSIRVTGNTGVDSLLFLSKSFKTSGKSRRNTITITAHRRENWGGAMDSICRAVRSIAAAKPNLRVVWPVHPGVRARVTRQLAHSSNVLVIEPQPYEAFVELLGSSVLVLTDSGGIQEEATVLGLPVLILRDRTERPEVLSAGNGILVGTNERRIVAAALRLLDDPAEYRAHAKRSRVFGDGRAGERIAQHLARQIGARGSA